MKPIKMSLDELIKKQIEYINTLDDGTEEKSKANDELTKLYALRSGEAGTFKDRAKLVLEGLGLVVSVAGLGVSVWATKKGFKFEETGSITSSTFRQWWSGLFKRVK